ncbi:MAG: sugar phosphate nucleotidyltransferase [Candidatus Nanopelagicales bacterium]
MIGLILAAGAGRRLKPYTDTLPKALIPVADDRSVMDVILNNFSRVGITHVAVVVGYAAQEVEKRKKTFEEKYNLNLDLIFNDKAEIWNNAYSLWCARDLFSQPVLLSNGDTVHPIAVEEILLANRNDSITLAIDNVKKLAEEEMKVTTDCAGNLARINKMLDPVEAFGEYIGVTMIEPAAKDALSISLEATWKADTTLYYEDGYQEFVDRGNKIYLQPIGEQSWVEVDNHEDLEKARKIACHYK